MSPRMWKKWWTTRWKLQRKRRSCPNTSARDGSAGESWRRASAGKTRTSTSDGRWKFPPNSSRTVSARERTSKIPPTDRSCPSDERMFVDWDHQPKMLCHDILHLQRHHTERKLVDSRSHSSAGSDSFFLSFPNGTLQKLTRQSSK